MRMREFIATVSLVLAGVLLAGGAFAQSKAKSEDEIGLRREPLTDETKEMPAHGEYGKPEAGRANRSAGRSRTVRRSSRTT